MPVAAKSANSAALFSNVPVIRMTKSKIASDTIWSYAAFAVMAASGLTINVVVGAIYGASGLGVFSQAMAVFVIVSHFSAAGLHNATFRAVALTPEAAGGILASGILAALPFAATATVLLAACAPAIGLLLDSAATAQAILWMAPGILFFGINKVGLAALNAMALMRSHAIGQMLRYAAIGGVVLLICLRGDGAQRLGAAFAAAEILVTLYLLLALRPLRQMQGRRPSLARAGEMLRFGLRSAAGGLLTEMNLRIDTLILGLYLPDREVGIYAFAALLIEGLLNIALVARNLVNPYLTRLLAAGDAAAIRRLVRQVQLLAWPAIVIAFLAAWQFYQPAVRFAVGDGDLELALAPLLILVALMAPYFTYAAFEETMMLAGHAGKQSIYQLAVTALNAALNFALIPVLGIAGAALATGLASLFACLCLIWAVYRVTGHALLPWPTEMSLLQPDKDR